MTLALNPTEQPMKIAIFTENTHRGGLDTFIATLINHWPSQDAQFTLLCNENHPGLGDIRSRLRRPRNVVTYSMATYWGLVVKTRGTPVWDMMRRAMAPVIKYVYLVYAVFKLRDVLCRGQYDRLLVVNGGYPGGDTCRAAGICWGLFSGRPLSVHNFHNLPVPPRKLVWIQEHMVDNILSRYTRSFVTVSRAAAASMNVRPAIPSGKVSYIYNGLESPEGPKTTVNVRSELGLPANAPLCLIMGTYEPRKGHGFLIKAFRRVVDTCPEAHLLSCGYGSEKEIEGVRRSADELGLHGHVHVFGFRNDAMDLLSQADVLVVASQGYESFGLTCVEAMARRIPVLTTNVGGLPEVVENGKGGYCVPSEDAEQYAAKLLQLLMNPKVRKEQGNLGYERFERLFKAERMSQEYASMLEGEEDMSRKGDGV